MVTKLRCVAPKSFLCRLGKLRVGGSKTRSIGHTDIYKSICLDSGFLIWLIGKEPLEIW